MKSQTSHQHGGINLLLITFLSVISVFIIATIQTRLLLAIQRTKSISDSLISQYDSESTLYDYLTRILNDYTVPVDFTETLADGTELQVKTETVGNKQIITVTAIRPFAVNKLEAVKETISTSTLQDVEILLSIDCTGSMGDPADITDPMGKTRYEAAEAAAINFVSAALDPSQNPNADKFKVGIPVFQINAKWLIEPTNDYQAINNAIAAGFGRKEADSPICKNMVPNTSIGTGFVFAYDYFNAHPVPLTTKRVVIVVTDGRTNSRMPYAACAPSSFCPQNGASCPSNVEGWQCEKDISGNYIVDSECRTPALDFMRCALATTDAVVPAGKAQGIRDPNIDAYLIKMDTASTFQEEKIADDYSTHYYRNENANELTGILDEILGEIAESSGNITIRRVVE